MSPVEIKIAMMRKGVSQRELARKLGVTQPTIHHIIYKRAVSARIMPVIAEAIGQDVKYVFPEHFLKKAS